jgi:hypothetical protein
VIGRRQKPAHHQEYCSTPPGVLMLIYLWGFIFNVLYHLYVFVADLIACRLDVFMSAVGSLCDCYKWCLLLLAGWCEESYGVRVSEALTAYVVLVLFLLVGVGEVSRTQYLISIKCMSRSFNCMSLGFIPSHGVWIGSAICKDITGISS